MDSSSCSNSLLKMGADTSKQSYDMTTNNNNNNNKSKPTTDTSPTSKSPLSDSHRGNNKTDDEHKTSQDPETDNRAVDTTITISPWQQLLNFIVSYFWVGPVMIMYWASTWNLVSGEIVLPDHIYASIWTSAAIGFGILFLASVFQRQLYSIARPKNNSFVSKLFGVLFSRVYTYVEAFAAVNQWISVWRGWDTYTYSTTYNALGTFLVAYFILLSMGCSANVLAAPSVVALDVPLETYFVTSTRFQTKVGTWQHVLDSLFTAVVIPFCVVTSWRGMWYLEDHWLRPDDLLISALWSIGMAYGLAGLLLLTRRLWKRLSILAEERHWLLKYLVEDTHLFLSSLVAVSAWRGLWLLYEQDFLDYPSKFWYGHALSYVLLTITLCSNSLVPKGCLLDGAATGGKGIELDIYCVTNLLRIWKQSKAKSEPSIESGQVQRFSSLNGKDQKTTEHGPVC